MTAAIDARIVACKEGPCMACWTILGDPEGDDNPGCDYHHLLRGGRRRGDRFGIALCAWHHRRVPDEGKTPRQMREEIGPSLMDGSRLFHAAYGTDDELLARQDALIGWTETEVA